MSSFGSSFTFDASSVPDDNGARQSFAIKPGWYPATVASTEISENSKGNGRYVKVVFEVHLTDGRKRDVWHWINFEHANETAQRIGQAELKALCVSAGVPKIQSSTAELHGKRIGLQLTVDRSDSDRNRVKGIKPVTDIPGQAAAADSGFASDDDIPF